MFRLEGRIRRRPAWVEWWEDGTLRADSPATFVVALDAFADHRDRWVGPLPGASFRGEDQRFHAIPAYLILKKIFGRAKVTETGELPELEPPEGAIA